jgi:hypothetical protein
LKSNNKGRVEGAMLLTIADKASIIAAFGNIGLKVGPRKGPDHRTTPQREAYNLRQYLTTLADHDMLSYPLEVAKSERPDFLLCDPTNGRCGLEVTEATTRSYQHELAKTEGQEGWHLLPGGGWVGNSAERECCAAILCAANRKARSIKKAGYTPADRYDLLLYINIRAFFYNEEDMVEMLVSKARPWAAHWKLGKVSAITNDNLLYDLGGDSKTLALSHPAKKLLEDQPYGDAIRDGAEG